MKSKFIILFIIIILALSSTSVAALMFWQGQNLPILNMVVTAPFVESRPSEVMSNMYSQLKILSTARYDVQSEINWKVYDEVFKINIDNVFEGDLRGRPIGKMVTNMGMKIEGLVFLSTIESRFTEEKIYYSIKEVPAIPFVDLKNIHNKWYEFQLPDSNQETDDMFLGFDANSISKYIKSIERLPDEYIDNKLAYHYLVLIDLEKINNLLNDNLFSNINIGKGSVELVELWIGKQSFLPYKIISEYQINEMEIKNIISISEFNESVAIDRPEEGIKTDKFIKDLFGKTNLLDLPIFGYLVGLDDKYLTDDPDEDKLYSIWEDIFGTDKNNNDTDSDGFMDREEIRNGYNPNGVGRLKLYLIN